MQIKINTVQAEVQADCSLRRLLAERKLDEGRIVVVLNDEVVHKGKWDSLKLNPGDSLEIIRLIGGG